MYNQSPSKTSAKLAEKKIFTTVRDIIIKKVTSFIIDMTTFTDPLPFPYQRYFRQKAKN